MILDPMLPGLDGLEVCNRLRRSERLAPILMLAARKEAERKMGRRKRRNHSAAFKVKAAKRN